MALDLGKAKKILSSTFLEDNENISEDEAAALIVKAEQQIKGLRDEMAADEQLQAAAQVKKDLESGYKNAIKYEEAKIQYLLAKIDEIQEGVNPSASV
jgi:small-conductance mechanosensitive channel